jgi:tetratricopeptide (TPR) repeat protein
MTFRLLVLFCGAAALTRAETSLEQAIARFNAKDYPAARAMLEKITAAEPDNAAACYYLGEVLLLRGDAQALDDAIRWLDKAATNEPTNADYLADFGGASLQLAGRNNSFTAAIRGRDAMEASLRIDPENLDARQGLMQFYQRAPWPLGSSAKADAQLEEIRRRDPDLATALSVNAKADAKDYAAAFQLCEAVLAKSPENYTALYQFGRTASLSGQNLDRGLSCLKKCLALQPPGPGSPQPASVWSRIGVIEEKLGHVSEARAAYEAAVRLDPGVTQATAALARLKPPAAAGPAR